MGVQIFLTRNTLLCAHFITLSSEFSVLRQQKSKNIVMHIVLFYCLKEAKSFSNTAIITCFKILTAKFHIYSPDFAAGRKCEKSAPWLEALFHS